MSPGVGVDLVSDATDEGTCGLNKGVRVSDCSNDAKCHFFLLPHLVFHSYYGHVDPRMEKHC